MVGYGFRAAKGMKVLGFNGLKRGKNIYDGISSNRRWYFHFDKVAPEDYELPEDTMPNNMGEVMKSDPKMMDFFENYWYWKVRGEATLLNPDTLMNKTYKQLARDMGMQIATEPTEHMIGLLELYEYLKSSPFIGPFGTVENPVIVPSVNDNRIVGCTGGPADEEHVPLWFKCREGFLYRCGECDQIFMLARVNYALPNGDAAFPLDPDVSDVFDTQLLNNAQKLYNSKDYIHWPTGNLVYKQLHQQT